jgi:hypothetical protein
VRFNWDVSDRYIKLEYRGAPARLIECGAIEPTMADSRKGKGGQRRRVDSAGHHFQRTTRVITRETISAELSVVRYIGDPKFAETLPGVPPGLRFKRLDWLDAHPDELHRHIDEEVNGCGSVYRLTRLAGTAANLISIAGYSEKLFRSKMVQRTGSHEYIGANEARNNGNCAWLCSLMRGYFEISYYLEKSEAQPHLRGPVIQANADSNGVPSARPSLRIVVNNEFAGGCTA